MLYYLLKYLDSAFDFPGAGLYQFLTFRSGVAFILALLLSLVFGKKIINKLRRMQIGETVRELGLEGQNEKAGTPTMGGVIIIFATLVPVLLLSKIDNIYILILLLTTIWMGTIGFLDDYIKVFKKDKEGLKGRFKVFGQISLGIIVGALFYFHPDITIRDTPSVLMDGSVGRFDIKSMETTIPFFKNNTFDYGQLISWMGEGYQDYVWLVFIPIVIFIITAVSNGANLTDGIDGLAAGTSAIIVIALGIFAFVSGNFIFSNYLNIMFIPNAGEMTVYICAFVGALVGFLWYNTYPAQVFMGDTGSLTIGGIIAVIAIAVRKELIIPVLCGIFLAENFSVVLQVAYFKYTKKRFGEGRRIFLMSPLHHHFQKKGLHESKIVSRFWIVGILLAIFCVISLKLR